MDTTAVVVDTAKAIVLPTVASPRISALLVIITILAANLLFAVGAVRAVKAIGGIKKWLEDFPTHNGMVVVALLMIIETGLIVDIRLALGMPFPTGYEWWGYTLLGLAGVNVAGLGIKRATDFRFKAAGTMEGAEKIMREGAPVTQENSNKDVAAGLEAVAAKQRVAEAGHGMSRD